MTRVVAAFLALVLLAAGCANVSPPVYTYPAQGQGAVNVSRDRAECEAWAKQQTGYDPVKDTALAAILGGLIGAGLGAAAGEIIKGEPGKGAAAGGLAGAAIGGITGFTNSRDGFIRAYSACMQARGYTVR